VVYTTISSLFSRPRAETASEKAVADGSMWGKGEEVSLMASMSKN
jgi:hypothetical protein